MTMKLPGKLTMRRAFANPLANSLAGSPLAGKKLPFAVVTAAVAAMLLAGCAAGPDYRPVSVPLPAAFKEGTGQAVKAESAAVSAPASGAENGNWKPAEPQDSAARGPWWNMFGDGTLNALQVQLAASNQTVAASEAAYRQARALVDAASAAYFPTLSADASATRSQSASSTRTSALAPSGASTSHSLSLQASWEPDVWGSLRRSLEASRDSVDASAGDLAAARLSAQAELATDYFQLRILDTQGRLYADTIKAYEQALTLTQNRYKGGVATKADVASAEVQLKSAQAQAIDLAISRAQYEHAIAVLVGSAPSSFSLAPADFNPSFPAIPAALPATMLQRRPDVAAAERRVASANASVGVASAAWFPTMTLGASGGYQSTDISQWFTAPSRFWSIGPTLAVSLFDGGAKRAKEAQARATYDQTVASYRQIVLTSIQDAEDRLVNLRLLVQEAEAQQAAVAAAREELRLATNQYKSGTVSYLNVTSAQTTLLTSQRSLLDLSNRRLAASVGLVKALGGGMETPPASN